ncbi:MAG: TIGR00725 family protein [Telmatospirillum sp.]|nr:TIGR00725 family protein [Telmatospirillum sp.]
MSGLMLCREAKRLYCGALRFDAWGRKWVPAEPLPAEARPVTPREALTWLSRDGGLRAVPIAVIGPREASARQLDAAARVGRGLAALGVPLLTGGKGGVMEAASRGAREAGGLTIGFIPDEDWRLGNDHVAIPLATGIGPARNILIARSAEALIAVGGEYGTLSEMAFGMQFGKPVFSLCDAPGVRGVVACADPEECIEKVSAAVLRLPSLPPAE